MRTKDIKTHKKELDKKQGLADVQNNQDLLTKGNSKSSLLRIALIFNEWKYSSKRHRMA